LCILFPFILFCYFWYSGYCIIQTYALLLLPLLEYIKREQEGALTSFTVLFDFFHSHTELQISLPSHRRCLYIIGITILAASNGISFFHLLKICFLVFYFLCSHLMLSLPPPLNFSFFLSLETEKNDDLWLKHLF
jgi:hypothetical protein